VKTRAARKQDSPKIARTLPRDFYNRDTETVARELLGNILCVGRGARSVSGVIVETEAYLGEHDPACHAAAGLTPRTQPLYAAPGTAYVYFIYGRYWCVNAVTREAGLPSAVLIRAVEPLQGIPAMRRRRECRRDEDLTNGPAKLCMAMGIDGRHNNTSLLDGEVVIVPGEPLADAAIDVSGRIGISRAAEWPLRYFVRGNRFVSKGPRAL
jgi:DNA-3-methyladenine glycosylase